MEHSLSKSCDVNSNIQPRIALMKVGGGGRGRGVGPHLHNIRAKAVVEPHPVARRHHADARHAAEDGDPYPPPVVVEVIGVDLGAEDGQDERQDGQQVDLAPELQDTVIVIANVNTKKTNKQTKKAQGCASSLTALQ